LTLSGQAFISEVPPLNPDTKHAVDIIFNGTEEKRRVNKRFSDFKAPPSEHAMLSLALKVKPTLDTNTDHFLDAVKRGLAKAYMEGKYRKLGIGSKKKFNRKRFKRELNGRNNSAVEVLLNCNKYYL